MVMNLESIVLISDAVARDGPARLELQRPSQFRILDDFSKNEDQYSVS